MPAACYRFDLAHLTLAQSFVVRRLIADGWKPLLLESRRQHQGADRYTALLELAGARKRVDVNGAVFEFIKGGKQR